MKSLTKVDSRAIFPARTMMRKMVHGKPRVWCSFRATHFPLLPDDVCVFCELLGLARGCVVGASDGGISSFFAGEH